MPICRPRKRASASSSSRCSSCPATITEPVSGRSSPAITISSVDLPEPDGPTRPIASPRPILRSMSLQDMDARRAAAERQIDAGKRDGEASGRIARDVVHDCRLTPHRSSSSCPLIWVAARARPDRRCGGLYASRSLARRGAVGAARRAPVKIVALGDSLTAGYRPARQRRVSGPARKQPLPAKGIAVGDRECRRLRRYRRGRSRPARLVGAGGHRRGDRRTRRQRHAARHRPDGDARRARHHPAPPDGAPYRGAALRHAARRANLGRRLRATRSTRSIRSSRRNTTRSSIRSSSTASPPTAQAQPGATACIPTAAGVDVIVARILPKVEELIARVRAQHPS